MHILIVDDLAVNIQLMMDILEEDNYSFSYASNGPAALEQVKQDCDKIDLILLDIMMPGMNGLEVCKKIKECTSSYQIPIIFLTAKTDIDTIRQGFSLGAVDYISKPFHAVELLARVKTHIELYQAKRLLQQNNIALESQAKYERTQLLSELEQNQAEIIWMLTELMESTFDETGQHCRRVAEISALLAHHHPELNEDDVELLRHASPMHDVGKMTVPYEILHKPGRYTEEEFQAMKLHTSNAHKLLSWSERPLIKAASIIAYEHHEKWNGKGYPQGLKGSKIHIYGRIVALADVFDALTHSRLYKDAWNINKVVDYIKEHDGTQFDPELVAIFIRHLDEFIAIASLPEKQASLAANQ